MIIVSDNMLTRLEQEYEVIKKEYPIDNKLSKEDIEKMNCQEYWDTRNYVPHNKRERLFWKELNSGRLKPNFTFEDDDNCNI